MVFDPTADEDQLLQQLETTTSTLMGWFQLNRDDAFARTLLYHDVPSHYVWDKSQWTKRTQKVMNFCAACAVSALLMKFIMTAGKVRCWPSIWCVTSQ
jgi:hypothetical protein